SLVDLDERVEERNRLATAYTEALSGIPGIRVPVVPAGDRSTYKDYSVLVDPAEFGIDADMLGNVLRSEGIETRRYYSPPVHAMHAYASLHSPAGSWPVTDRAAQQALTLPLWVRS